MERASPVEAVEKLAGILRIATIDIECVGCKEVYPDFIPQLISRISESVASRRRAASPPPDRRGAPLGGFRENTGQLIGVSWTQLKDFDRLSAAKPLRGRGNLSDPVHAFRIGSERKARRGARERLKTPRTERFQYKLAKANEIDLAAEKKSQRQSGCKDVFRTPLGANGKRVRLNELSSGGKFVFGRSGSKWDRGENFEDVVGLDFYEDSGGRR